MSKVEKSIYEINKEPRPVTLYKFRQWSDTNHQKLLTEGKLWIANSDSLNDPFDCRIPPRFGLMQPEDFAKMLAPHYQETFSIACEQTALEMAKKKIDELGFFDPARSEKAFADFANDFRLGLGVLSFASAYRIPLMWSHYAEGHKGFCVGIDSSSLESSLGPLCQRLEVDWCGSWIHYIPAYPKIMPKTGMLDEMVQLAITKSDSWNYEKEYRYVFSGKYDFPLDMDSSWVTEVILGAEMSTGDRLVIRLLAEKQFPDAKILQAKAKPFSFELEFVPVVDD